MTDHSRRARVEQVLSRRFDTALVGKLVEALVAMQTAYAEGRLRPSELEAGHFAEIAYRICEQEVLGTHTAIGRPLTRLDQLTQRLASAPSGHDSFRLHIPRVLLGIAEVRNRRGVGHPSGDIDPNPADAELVLVAASWTTAELLRHAAGLDIRDAQELVNDLATRQLPVLEVIDNDVVFLDVTLSAKERVLLLLLHLGGSTSRAELAGQLKTTSGSRLRTVLSELRKAAYLHEKGSALTLTRTGKAEAESVARARIQR